MKIFDAGKTRMIATVYMVKKNYDGMLSRFHLIPERNGRTDRRADRFAISISRVSMLTRDKKSLLHNYSPTLSRIPVETSLRLYQKSSQFR